MSSYTDKVRSLLQQSTNITLYEDDRVLMENVDAQAALQLYDTITDDVLTADITTRDRIEPDLYGVLGHCFKQDDFSALEADGMPLTTTVTLDLYDEPDTYRFDYELQPGTEQYQTLKDYWT